LPSERLPRIAGAVASALAQAGAEFRMRRRSPGTLVALAAILITTAIWIPDPNSGDSSISWIRSADGVRVSGAYNIGYLGAASAASPKIRKYAVARSSIVAWSRAASL
jgi:hypothetical protein